MIENIKGELGLLASTFFGSLFSILMSLPKSKVNLKSVLYYVLSLCFGTFGAWFTTPLIADLIGISMNSRAYAGLGFVCGLLIMRAAEMLFRLDFAHIRIHGIHFHKEKEKKKNGK